MPQNTNKTINPVNVTSATNPNISTVAEQPALAVIETVTIPKSTLDDLMARISRVEASSDKARLSTFDAKHKGEMGKTVKLRLMNGKVVLFWDKMLENIVEKKPNGTWYEDQRIKLHYEDETTEEIDLVIFNRRFTYLVATVESEVKELKDGTENITYKVKTEDGAHYTIGQAFIN